MKKALVILLALTMVFGAFADPDVTVSVTEFKGSAEFGWTTNLEAETMGMYNTDEASLKIQFIDKEATRTTEGDGLWGELKIKAGDKVELKAGAEAWTIPTVSVDTAKIHFVDGDTYARLNIKAPSFDLASVGYTKATDANGDNDKFGDKFGAAVKDYAGFTLEAGIPMVDFEFAFGDNGKKAPNDAKEYAIKAAATLKPIDGLSVYGGVAYATAEEKAAIAANAAYKLSLNDTFYVEPKVALNVKDKAKSLGLAVLFGWGGTGAEPGFKKAADLDAAFADYEAGAKKLAIAAFDPDDTSDPAHDVVQAALDTLFASYEYAAAEAADAATPPATPTDAAVYKLTQATIAAAIAPWVDAEVAADLKAIKALYPLAKVNVANKCADGISFNTVLDLENSNNKPSISINAYDSTFVPGLKAGARFAGSTDDLGKGEFAAAAKYSNDFGILTLDADFAFGIDLSKDEDNSAMSYAVKASTDDVIANTTLFAQYDGANASVFGETVKGSITLGAKISF